MSSDLKKCAGFFKIIFVGNVAQETIAELRFKTEEFKKKLPPKVLARIEKEMKAKEEGNVVSNYPCNCVIA